MILVRAQPQVKENLNVPRTEFQNISRLWIDLLIVRDRVNQCHNSIRGLITRTGTTTGIGAVTVTLTSPTPAGFAARTVQTTSTGSYKFANVPAGRNYTIKPTKTGFTFTPTMRSITNLSSNIPAGASTNFTGTGP